MAKNKQRRRLTEYCRCLVQKWIPPHGIAKPRVYKNLNYLRLKFAEKNAGCHTDRQTDKGKIVFPPLFRSGDIKAFTSIKLISVLSL